VLKSGFHKIAAITERKKIQPSQREIEIFLSLQWLQSLESGFHMIAMIGAIAGLFSQRLQRS